MWTVLILIELLQCIISTNKQNLRHSKQNSVQTQHPGMEYLFKHILLTIGMEYGSAPRKHAGVLRLRWICLAEQISFQLGLVLCLPRYNSENKVTIHL